MKKFLALIALMSVFALNCAEAFALSEKDTKDVIKFVKKVERLSDKNKIKELTDCYSDDYVSFDKYTKEEMKEVFKIASKLYPKTKTKGEILKIEEKEDNTLKVYIQEQSTANMTIKGEDVIYASKNVIKGKMTSTSNHALIIKKENGVWKIKGDEIYGEETKIEYGEAISADFKMETPNYITPGEEFSVKTTISVPENRFAVGSIGHDKVIFLPKKYNDPYRSIDQTGVLERIMIANKEGQNEYINSTFAFIAPCFKKTKDDKTTSGASVSGMGIQVKRVNVKQIEANL